MATGIAVLTVLCSALSGQGEIQQVIHPEASFKVNGDLVIVAVSVSDRKGHTILGLTADDFTVLDENIRQDIVSFSRWEVPSSIGVIFDVSGSMRGTERVALRALRSLVDDMSPNDEGFLVTFSDVPRIEVEMTRNFNSIPDHLSFVPRQGATALFDAVAMGVQHIKGAYTPRRALIVVTDGGDNRSRLSFRELLSTSLEADVQVYVIALRRDVRDLDEQRGRLQLDRLAAETGGRLFTIDAASQLNDTMSRVRELIRNQYLIGYKRPGGGQNGKWRRIRVRVQSIGHGSFRINAKGGYYAPSE